MSVAGNKAERNMCCYWEFCLQLCHKIAKATPIRVSSTDKSRLIAGTRNTGKDITSTFETDNLDLQTRTLFIFDKTLFLLAVNYFPCACWSNAKSQILSDNYTKFVHFSDRMELCQVGNFQKTPLKILLKRLFQPANIT